MRTARDEILRRVESWLTDRGYVRVGEGHFTYDANKILCHIGFQKLRSGRDVRVLCHIEDTSHLSVTGPRSDDYQLPNSPNGRKYWFAWSTRESDKDRCTNEICDYLNDVVLAWFSNQKVS